MAKTKTVNIALKCTECGSLNYTKKKNPTGDNKEKIEVMKHCKPERKHTLHKEAKISKAKK